MTINEFDKIDIIAEVDDSLVLLIADPGTLVREDRLYALKRKLATYDAALKDPGFRQENAKKNELCSSPSSRS